MNGADERDKGRLRRLSIGTAASFAVAAVAGVAGGRITDHVTPALVVFAVLVVAGVLISYWVDRSTRAGGEAGDQDGSGTGSVQRLGDMRGARQVIIASGQGSVAQGAYHGDVINHGDVRLPGSPALPAADRPDAGDAESKDGGDG